MKPHFFKTSITILIVLYCAFSKNLRSDDLRQGYELCPQKSPSLSNHETKYSNSLLENSKIRDGSGQILHHLSLGDFDDTVDKQTYDALMGEMAKNDSGKLWPIKQPYPLKRAILPFHRIVAFYGNLYTPKMGILGMRPSSYMLEKLRQTCKDWEEGDPATPVVPALHYIAVVASSTPADEGLYIKRMPATQIEKVLKLADQANAIVFLDIQPGFSTLERELPRLRRFLSLPHVHLGIDPEFFMKGKSAPGKVLGNITAKEINFAINFLAELVDEYNLPPKVLVIHRFKMAMLKHYYSVKPAKQVQVVVHMDGWGTPSQKKSTYDYVAYNEPIQFTGFKIFYNNDLKYAPYRLVTVKEMLELSPIPLYIQYQ